MGLFDIFSRKKKQVKLLEQGSSESVESTTSTAPVSVTPKSDFDSRIAVESTSIPTLKQHKPTTSQKHLTYPTFKVFSKENHETGKIEYNLVYELAPNSQVLVSTIYDNEVSDLTLREIVEKFQSILDDVQSKTQQGSSKSQLSAEITSKLTSLSNLVNMSPVDLDNIYSLAAVPTTGNYIDYRNILDSLPKVIDTKSMTPEQIHTYGQILSQRIAELQAIQTPEDAYLHREALSSFMKSQENLSTLENIIVGTNLENLSGDGKPLDLDTIIALARDMETLSSEDSLLYSVYLKLEEDRILKQLHKDLENYQSTLGESQLSTAVEALRLMEYCDSLQLGTYDQDNMGNILGYMFDTLRSTGIVQYSTKTAAQDKKLLEFLKNNPVENADKATQYLYSRIASLGQLADIPPEKKINAKIPSLRECIQTTDYKDPDHSSSDKFLLLTAKVEEDYIRRNFASVLEQFQEICHNNRPAQNNENSK